MTNNINQAYSTRSLQTTESEQKIKDSEELLHITQTMLYIHMMPLIFR